MNLQGIALELFIGLEKPALKALLNTLYSNNPVNAKLAVAEAYPLIDTKLEDWAIKNGAENPKTLVNKAKEVCEETAAEWGLTLSNVDAGTPND